MKEKEFLLLSPEQLSGTAKPVDKSLRESLRVDGQAFPLVIYGEKAPFKVIDGHKRLAVLQESGSDAECLRLVECSVIEAAEEEVRLNAQRGLTMLEKAGLVDKLKREDVSEEQILDVFLKKLKLPQEKRVLDELVMLAKLPEEEQVFFAAKNFGEYLLTLIFNLPDEERSVFLRFAGQYRLNHNQGRDVLEKLLQMRQKKPLCKVLQPWIERYNEEPEKASLFFKRFGRELDVLCNEGSETWQKLGELKSVLPKNSILDEKEYLKNGVVVLTSRLRNLKDVENLSASMEDLKNNL